MAEAFSFESNVEKENCSYTWIKFPSNCSTAQQKQKEEPVRQPMGWHRKENNCCDRTVWSNFLQNETKQKELGPLIANGIFWSNFFDGKKQNENQSRKKRACQTTYGPGSPVSELVRLERSVVHENSEHPVKWRLLTI
jgi:hypothetical protein